MPNKKYNDWEYGNVMLKKGMLDSLDDWSDEKELVLSTMDELFDYIWYENKNGFHFIDKYYSEGIIDIIVEKRILKKEERMHFNTLADARKWLIKKIEETNKAKGDEHV